MMPSLIEWGIDHEYVVRPERCVGWGWYADLVFLSHNNIVWAIEAKLARIGEAIRQAEHYMVHSHKVSVAFPADIAPRVQPKLPQDVGLFAVYPDHCIEIVKAVVLPDPKEWFSDRLKKSWRRQIKTDDRILNPREVYRVSPIRQ
jgi:hypothetical protein